MKTQLCLLVILCGLFSATETFAQNEGVVGGGSSSPGTVPGGTINKPRHGEPGGVITNGMGWGTITNDGEIFTNALGSGPFTNRMGNGSLTNNGRGFGLTDPNNRRVVNPNNPYANYTNPYYHYTNPNFTNVNRNAFNGGTGRGNTITNK